MSLNYPVKPRYLLLLFLLSLSLDLPPAKAQSQFEGLEFPYTDEDQYGLNGTFYWKRFFKSLTTWRRPDCNRFNLPPISRELANFGIYERDGAIYLDSAYFELALKALSRKNEYLVVDVIQEAQYPCNNPNKINQRLES
ncbi:MAG: hypothetical protein ACPF9D_01115 [Owenweeksia sp.]